MTLDEAIQLHEEMRVWYAVDGYVAELQTHDGDRVAVSCRGDTPEAAIEALKAELATITTLRMLRELPNISITSQ